MSIAAASPPKTFEWNRFPETEAFVDRLVAATLASNGFAETLARRMREETSTRFVDWIDHFELSSGSEFSEDLEGYGYQAERGSVGGRVYRHHGGIFPTLVVSGKAGPDIRSAAIKVESVADFSGAHHLGLEIAGYPLGPYRIGTISGGETSFSAVERRGYLGFEPFSSEMARNGRMAPQAARAALAAKDLWKARQRKFADDAEGFESAESTLSRVIETAGAPDLACHLVFEVEREYWQARNRAARVQKERQDRLGLGWANHDHHTFRCSRRFFPDTMRMFETLGFFLRERFHAGAHAGWGAQVLEHPTTGIVIFADLDLAPEEAAHDFAHDPLPELDRPNTVGLWVGLHGESLLEAGMHHLEAQFDFESLRDDLKREAQVETMKPFSDFPFLRQAFTSGERWPVDRLRADRLRNIGWIDDEQHARFLSEGAIGSHLENLQRREGYKGFNQQAVSAIIAATDPRLSHPSD